jgi:hypothetical protein
MSDFRDWTTVVAGRKSLPYKRRILAAIAVRPGTAETTEQWLQQSPRSSVYVGARKENWKAAAVLHAVEELDLHDRTSYLYLRVESEC